jgi:hypothetical protein
VTAYVLVESGDVVGADGFSSVDNVFSTDSRADGPPLTITVDTDGGDVTLVQALADPAAPASLASPTR